jgi:hypothetical protein
MNRDAAIGIPAVKRLLIVAAFLIILGGCGLGTDRDVRAYNTCLARHPEDAAVCEGPRQAYEVDPSMVQARSAEGGTPAGYGSEARSALSSSPQPILLHPGTMSLAAAPNR